MRRAFKTNKILQAIQIKWEDITKLKAAHTFHWGIIIFQNNRRTHWHIFLILERYKEFRRCINQVLAFAIIYDKPLPLTHCCGTVYPRRILKSVPLPKQCLHLSLMLWPDRCYHHGRPYDSFRTLWAKVLKLCPLVMSGTHWMTVLVVSEQIQWFCCWVRRKLYL
jgi:hypothetical protein